MVRKYVLEFNRQRGVRDITRSVWEGYGFDAQTASQLNTLYLQLLCKIRDINSTSKGNALAPKHAQLITMQLGLPVKVRASKGWLSAMQCDQGV